MRRSAAACTAFAAGAILVCAAAGARDAHAAARPPSPRWVARVEALDARMSAAFDSGRIAEAVRMADSAVALRRERHGARSEAVTAYLDSLALGFFGLGNTEGWEAAERYFDQSLEAKRRSLGPEDPAVARTLVALATLDDYLGQWPRAAERARQALEIRRKRLGENDPSVASSLRQLGMLEFDLGRYAAAESLVTRSLAIYERLEGDQAERIADDLNNLGEIHRVRDDFDRAEASFRRGLEIARARLEPDATLRVSLMNNLAGLYKDLARYDDAAPLAEESLRLREGSAEPEGIATACLNLGEIYRLQGRVDEAEPLYARGLEVARATLGAENPDLAPFVNQSAVLYQEIGQYERAEPLFREGLAMTEKALGPEHPLVAQGLDDFGRLLTERGSYAAAESTLGKALAVRARVLGDEHPDVAVTRLHLAACLSRDPGSAPGAAATELERVVARLDATRAYPEARLDAYALRSELRERSGDRGGAAADLAVALEAIDSLRVRRGGGDFSRAALLSHYLDLYHRRVRLAVAARDPEGAFEAHERGRARILLDQLDAAGLDLGEGIPAAEREPLEREASDARQRLARAQHAIEAARGRANLAEPARREAIATAESARDSAAWDLQRVGETIRERNPIWRRMLTTNGRPATRAEMATVLDRREALLEYHIGADGSFVFLLERGTPVKAAALSIDAEAARVLGVEAGPLDQARLERIVAGDRSARVRRHPGIAERLSGTSATGAAIAGSASRASLDASLEALARVLVPASLATRLARAREIVVVPDAALHLLPFEALVMGSGGKGVRYWLDAMPATRYAPSATSLVEIERRRGARETANEPLAVLSVSDPRFTRDPAPKLEEKTQERGGDAWAPLPGTRRETEAIRSAFAPAPVDTLVGAAATEPAVRAAIPTHRVLHLATHGFVTERRGEMLAGLVLTAPDTTTGTDDDGLLQLFEIYRLRIDAELAVLSACETARGPRVEGEGVFALSRGFLAAGTRRVVASLWAVNDASTAELMSGLFGRLAKARRDRAAIDYAALLRDAKRALSARAEYRSPTYWAPFVLSGMR